VPLSFLHKNGKFNLFIGLPKIQVREILNLFLLANNCVTTYRKDETILLIWGVNLKGAKSKSCD
jgi:hypothetical protein